MLHTIIYMKNHKSSQYLILTLISKHVDDCTNVIRLLRVGTTWNKEREDQEKEEEEKSSLIHHRADESVLEPRYLRKPFRRDPKSRTELLVNRTGRYKGQYSAPGKKTGVSRRAGLRRNIVTPFRRRGQHIWDSG